MTKPFAFVELLARVEALVRRGSQTPEASSLTAGDLSLDLQTRKVTRGEKRSSCRRGNLRAGVLMRNAGRVVTKTMILNHIWDYAFEPQTNVVDVLVCRVRNKVDKGAEKPRIKTMRGWGMCWMGSRGRLLCAKKRSNGLDEGTEIRCGYFW